MSETSRTSRVHSFCFNAGRVALWACFAETIILPILFARLPPNCLEDAFGIRWFAQGRFVADLIDSGYNQSAVSGFSAALNFFIVSTLIYLILRLGLVVLAPHPVVKVNVIYLSIFTTMVMSLGIGAGFGHGKGLYAISTLRPLAVDETLIFNLYLMLIVFAGELLAQVVAFARLRFYRAL